MEERPDLSQDTGHFERVSLQRSAWRSPLAGLSGAAKRLALTLAVVLLGVALVGALFHEQGAAALAHLTATPIPTRTAIPTPSPTPHLPQFSDWRVAYLDFNGRMHTLSLDGRVDNASQVTLSGGASPQPAFGRAASSPDGHMIAYRSDGGLVLVDIRAGVASTFDIVDGVNAVAWSPDSARLALTDRSSKISIFTVADHSVAPLPWPAGSVSVLSLLRVLGWRDASHILVQHYDDATLDSLLLVVVVDITSGAQRVIASIPSAALGGERLDLSPDGKSALLSNCPLRDASSFTPTLSIIDTTTGHMRSIFNARVGSCMSAVAWRPDAQMIAVSVDLFPPEDNNWIFDLRAGLVLVNTAAGYPVAWAPGGGPLIMSDGNQAQNNIASVKLTAVTVVMSPLPEDDVTILTPASFNLPLLGFVRTG